MKRTLMTLAAVVAVLATTAAAAESFSVEAQEARKARICGLSVDWTRSIELKISIVAHGPDGIEYVSVLGDITETFTNKKTGLTATSFANVLEKDLHVTENPDGTLTALELATGNATLYGPDGKAVARDPGQVRYTLYIDGDDVTFGEIVKDSTGRSDDFCSALVQALS